MTGVVSAAEAKRRADLLYARYDALAARATRFESGVLTSSIDPVSVALTGGREKFDDLAQLVCDDGWFYVWYLRLEHPWWWLGERVRYTTPLLARIISELVGRHDIGPHLSGSGYIGARWFNQTLLAIAPLSPPARDQLAVALRRELIGRNMCQHGVVFMDFVSDRPFDPAEMFPESEKVTPLDIDRLVNAARAVRNIHGAEWFEAFKVMVSGLDQITWAGVTEALNVELRERGTERE